MPIAANPKAAMLSEGTLTWFRFIVTAVNRQAQTFSGQIQTFDTERHLLARNAFAKTLRERGRVIPLLDNDSCQIGELTVMKGLAGALNVAGKFWSGLDKEYVKALAAAGRIALRIEILQRNGDQVTELRLLSAMIRKNISA